MTVTLALFNSNMAYSGLEVNLQFPQGVIVKELARGDLLTDGFLLETEAIMPHWVAAEISSAPDSASFSGDGVLLRITIEISAGTCRPATMRCA